MNYQEQTAVDEIGSEIAAAQHCFVILKQLDQQAQSRVIRFVCDKLESENRRRSEWEAMKKNGVANIPLPVK